MFRELPDPVALEEEVLAFWAKEGIFERTLKESEGRPTFVFYEGPPTANGTPHNGHVLTRVIKDLLPRYKTMRGFHVPRKAGWDTHGLPVEIEVEKELGMRGEGPSRGGNARDAILEYGLEKFSRQCVASVFKYTNEWRELTDRVGFWVDMDGAYATYHRSYVESVWWALSSLFDKGLLYQGQKVVWWWPEGGTALSTGEVGEGYRDVDDPSVTVRFPVEGEDGVSFLAWTTTPWTLPSNVALAVHPDLDYARTRLENGEVVITAAELAPEGETLSVFKGAALVGMRYQRLYETGDPGGRSFLVVPADYVTVSAGTGIVHTATGYGEEDNRLVEKEGLGMLQAVGPDGRVTSAMPEWAAGLHFKDADKPIMRDLADRGLLYHRGQVRHSYPFSPRSKDDPLMQIARPGWFIRTTAFKEAALKNNALVNWLPEHIQDGRFGDFLRNNVDWSLSRERFWGTPLPIWSCGACGTVRAFPGVKALEEAGATGFAQDVDRDLQVHRPWIDSVTVPCACGETMKRAPEVIDCWFDAGSMPFAQWGFPHQGKEEFAKAFPADFISEAVDQTRGWFYALLMISTLLFDDETCKAHGLAPRSFPRPYRNCVVLGLVCDMDGFKESKSKGNYTSPNLVLRGRMRQRVIPDDTLKPGSIGMVKAAVRSIDLANHERMAGSKGEHDEARMDFRLVSGPNRGKETVAMHPDDIAALGLEGECWLHAPFQAPGADAFRWLFYAANPPWTSTRLSLRGIREGQREFHLRLANVVSFFTIYANINGFTPDPSRPPSDDVMDRWIRSEVAKTAAEATRWLDQYRIFEAARALSSFVDSLSNWYVRRTRDRFWGDGEDATDALSTLHSVLGVLTRLIAPFVPFMAEAMHQRLLLPGDSVHLASWPTDDELGGWTDEALSDDMSLLRELASLGLAARARVGVKVRQPLRATEIILADPTRAARLAHLLPQLASELNVREVRFTDDADRFVSFKVKPDYRALGKRLGKEMKLCAGLLAKADPSEVHAGVLGDGFPIELPSGTLTLTEADVVVAVVPREHFEAAGSAAAVVVLHADLDDDLREEGLSREVISRISAGRKQLDLGYTDRIHLHITTTDTVIAAVRRFEAHICAETLTIALTCAIATGDKSDGGSEGEEATSEPLDGHLFSLTITPATKG
jgi:isoleucyl-tRNA synthetase